MIHVCLYIYMFNVDLEKGEKPIVELDATRERTDA